jgi:hypothetical protein
MTFLYAPLKWQEGLGYKVAQQRKDGKPRCRASVQERHLGWGEHQCEKPGYVQIDGAWLCRIHDPAAVAARRAASDAKYAKQHEKLSVEWAGPKFRQALQAIADGHNDPRACALEALGDLYVKPDSEAQS